MWRVRQEYRVAGFALAIVCGLFSSPSSAQRPLRPHPAALAAASPELIDRLRADPFTYFRFINRAWTERVCEAFADVTDPTIVRLHGDAHVEQFAVTKDAWGLDDFDDSTRGPAFIDVVRFLGSIDLATRQRGWTRDRDELWNRFFEGYRLGLNRPDAPPREPDIVRELRRQAPATRAAYLAQGEGQMQPMDEVRSTGGGSAAILKVLIRVQGPTTEPDDDVLLEAKEVTNLEGVRCLLGPTTPPAIRVIAGTRQLGRLKHDILAVGPTLLVPAAADRAEHWLDWWVSSWEPSYREVRLSDLRSVKDLADIAFDSGVQLGAGKVVSVRRPELSSIARLERRVRSETSTIVEELLAGWRELAGR